MAETPKSVEAFGAEHARHYDDRDGELLMGDRQRQRRLLADLLRCLPQEPPTFVELACGTGYFTEVFFEVFPRIRGFAFDGSEPMLEQTRVRFPDDRRDLSVRCELLQAMDWSIVGSTSLVFSAFAIHHLSHEEKRSLLRRIFDHLNPSGFFILFDAFRPDDAKADKLVERLSCLDIERRVRDARGTVPHLEHIIARDRESKEAEGDCEASIESHLHWLREIGFEGVAPVFLEARMGGIVAAKPRQS